MKTLAAIFLLGFGATFAEEPAAPKGSDAYVTVGFDQLAGFPFTSPPVQPANAADPAPLPDVMKQVPDRVKQLDGKMVILSGFMLPVKIERGLATEFLLLNTPLMCCFGITPSTNAWVIVKMPKGVKAEQDVPMSFRGRLHVRPQWDNGYLASIYQLDGEGVVKPGS